MKNLKTNKAAGNDEITSEQLKFGMEGNFMNFMPKFLNKSSNIKKFPKSLVKRVKTSDGVRKFYIEFWRVNDGREK